MRTRAVVVVALLVGCATMPETTPMAK